MMSGTSDDTLASLAANMRDEQSVKNFFDAYFEKPAFKVRNAINNDPSIVFDASENFTKNAANNLLDKNLQIDRPTDTIQQSWRNIISTAGRTLSKGADFLFGKHKDKEDIYTKMFRELIDGAGVVEII